MSRPIREYRVKRDMRRHTTSLSAETEVACRPSVNYQKVMAEPHTLAEDEPYV